MSSVNLVIIFSTIWKFLEIEGEEVTFHKHFLHETPSFGLSLAISLTCSSSFPYRRKAQFLHGTSQGCALSFLVCRVPPTGAPFIGFEGGIEETQSEESVRRFKGRGFDWSLCYLKALKLYNAKQVPFFFIYGSYIPPFITAIHSSSLTADNTKNSLLAKNSIYHSPQDNNF